MSEETKCALCGGNEGHIAEMNDEMRHSRMEECIRVLSAQFRAKEQRSVPPAAKKK